MHIYYEKEQEQLKTALIFGITNQFVKLFRKKLTCHTRFNFVDNFNIHKYLLIKIYLFIGRILCVYVFPPTEQYVVPLKFAKSRI